MKLLIVSLLVLSINSFTLQEFFNLLNKSEFPEKERHGLLPIDNKGSDMFYWLFDSRNDAKKDPLVIWLTGGPGCSGELALFVENGPFKVDKDMNLHINNHSWNNKANLLYVDQPIGTGFSKGSFLNQVTNEVQVAEDFMIFLKGFYAKYPEFKGRDLYVTGESYGGHYIPFIGDAIINSKLSYMNLKGVAIGNGWVDPLNQYDGYAEFAKDRKLVSTTFYYLMLGGLKLCKFLVKHKIPIVSIYACNLSTMIPLGNPLSPKFNTYDVTKKCDVPPLCYDFSAVTKYLNTDDVREKLGVQGRKWQDCNMLVHVKMLNDWFTDAAPKVANIVRAGKKVLVYNGKNDYICNWMGTRDWYNLLKGQLSKENNVENYGEFKFVTIENAGHMVPMDQPEDASKMINEFIN